MRGFNNPPKDSQELKFHLTKVLEMESFKKMMWKKHKDLCALENSFHMAFY